MKKASLLFIIQLFLSIIGFGQTVTIGTQVWASKNLDVSTFRNGDPIPEVKSDADWKSAALAKQPAWCYPNNDPVIGIQYGKLYNYYAMVDPRGLAPVGYHIASGSEWVTLLSFLGGQVAGQILKSTNGWPIGANGTNTAGFSALPAGYRTEAAYFEIGDRAAWWTGGQNSITNPTSRVRYVDSNPDIAPLDFNKGCGLSVRYIKD